MKTIQNMSRGVWDSSAIFTSKWYALYEVWHICKYKMTNLHNLKFQRLRYSASGSNLHLSSKINKLLIQYLNMNLILKHSRP